MRSENRENAVYCTEISTGKVEVFHSYTDAALALGVSNQLLSRAGRDGGSVLGRYRVRKDRRYYVVKTPDRLFKVCTYNSVKNRYEEVGTGAFWSEVTVLGVRDVTQAMV